MERENFPVLFSALLCLGAVVRAWRVVGQRGNDVYGAVYRVVRVGQEKACPVALKVAVWLGDPRFAREVGLLKRVSHPSIHGAGTHEYAATLTPRTMFPGAPAYLSPESRLFELRNWQTYPLRLEA